MDIWVPRNTSWASAPKGLQHDLRILWSNGYLRYKLDPDQKLVYDQIKESFKGCTSSAERWFALDIGRRWGKDRLMCTFALETMQLAPPRARIAYGAPTGDDCVEIIEPIILDMLEDCPPDLRPAFMASKHRFQWKDGRRIVLVGCDLHPRRLRGPGSVAFFLTEPAFMPNLDAPINSVMAAIEPQLVDNPNAYRIYGSTPPETPAHPWTTKYVSQAKITGRYAHRTTYDSPRYTKAQVDGFIKEAGGPTSTRARREYLAEHVVEESLMLIPEWLKVKDECVIEIERPKYADCYEALDPGWTAYTVELFAYLHFERQEVIIEDEFGEVRANTAKIAERTRAIEAERWGTWARYVDGKGLCPQPYKRVSDIDQRLIADLWAEHEIRFIPTEKKDTLDTEMAHLRLKIQNLKVRINPRCKILISHLDHGIWNKGRTAFAESAECGHFDAIAALMYLVRNVEFAKNPYPPISYGVNDTNNMIMPWANKKKSREGEVLEQAFSSRRSLKRIRFNEALRGA